MQALLSTQDSKASSRRWSRHQFRRVAASRYSKPAVNDSGDPHPYLVD